MHFPQYRLSRATLNCWETPEDYFPEFRARVSGDWSYSSADDIRFLTTSDDKVHLDVEINRFNVSGTRLTSFRSLWVITRRDGVWAAQFRSSFTDR